MVCAAQIRDLVYEYLLKHCDLSQFAEQFASIFCDIEDSGDREAVLLSYRIESELEKVSSGYASEASLQDALRVCVSVIVNDYGVNVRTEFTTPLVSVVSQFAEPSGTRPGVVFGLGQPLQLEPQTSTALLH